MEPKQYFEAVPVSELPEQGGVYTCNISNQDDRYRKEIEFFAGMWCIDDEDENVISWLRPVSMEEHDRDIAGNVFDKFIEALRYSRDTPPDKELFLNSLK